MGTYGSLKDIMQLWETEELTADQAIGQILLLLQIVEARLNDLERRQWEQRAQQTQRASHTAP
jgi:hypothetical protein